MYVSVKILEIANSPVATESRWIILWGQGKGERRKGLPKGTRGLGGDGYLHYLDYSDGFVV